MKYDSTLSSVNPEKCIDHYVPNSKNEKRIKLDMEYNWYFKQNLEINKNKTKDNDLAQPSSSNYVVPAFQINNEENSLCHFAYPGNSKMSKSDVPKLKSVHESFEKSHLPVIQNANYFENTTFKENESHCLKMCSNERHNFPTSYDSRQNISDQRKPLQLSPRQFLKSGKHLPQKLNDPSKKKRNFFPLFMPLDDKEENLDNTLVDINENDKTYCNENFILETSVINVLPSKESNLNPAITNVGEVPKTQEYSKYYI